MVPDRNAPLLKRAALHGVELTREQAETCQALTETAAALAQECATAKGVYDALKARADAARKAYEKARDDAKAAESLATTTRVESLRRTLAAAERARLDKEKARAIDRLAAVLAEERRLAG